jgi:hypothetical protein
MPRQTLKNKQSPGREDADPSVAFYNVYAQRPRRANRAVARKSIERCGEAFVEGLAYIDQSMDGRTDVHATNDLRFVSLVVIVAVACVGALETAPFLLTSCRLR